MAVMRFDGRIACHDFHGLERDAKEHPAPTTSPGANHHNRTEPDFRE